jgi:hypothetical protein
MYFKEANIQYLSNTCLYMFIKILIASTCFNSYLGVQDCIRRKCTTIYAVLLKFDVSILSQLLYSEIIKRVPECHRNISYDRSLLFILMLLYIFMIFISHEYSSCGKLDNIFFHNILYVTVRSPSHSLAQPEDFLMRAENR